MDSLRIFCNERVRQLADLIGTIFLYYEDALQNIPEIPATDDFIDDGSDVDGRKRITGNQVIQLLQGLSALKSSFDDKSLSGQIWVNPRLPKPLTKIEEGE